MESNINNITTNEFSKKTMVEIYDFIQSVGGVLSVETKNAIEDLFYEHCSQFNENNTLISTYTRSDIESLKYNLQMVDIITLRNDNTSTFISMKPEIYCGDFEISTIVTADYNSIEGRHVNICDEQTEHGNDSELEYFVCLVTTNSLEYGLFKTSYNIIIYVPEYNSVANMEQYLETYDAFDEEDEE